MAKSAKNNMRKESANQVTRALIKLSRASNKVKILVFIILFAGVGTILLRSSFAFAGWHDFSDSSRGIVYDTSKTYIAFMRNGIWLCGRSGSGIFLYGPYDSFTTPPSGMDITMALWVDQPHDQNQYMKVRTDIVINNGNTTLLSQDNEYKNGPGPYLISMGKRFTARSYYRMEYRVWSLSGDVCLQGYTIYTH